MFRYTMTLTWGAVFLLTLTGNALAQVNWDGGSGAWNSANWEGGQTAGAVFGGVTRGLQVGSGELSDIVNITSGTVTYDPNPNALHIDGEDFRFRDGGTLNLSGGATFSMNSASDSDGRWTQFDGDALNIDNATFNRTFSGPSLAGGALIFGSWNSTVDQVIRVNLTNGGTINNDGQLWFGAWDDNDPGIDVSITINDGNLNLTGGDNVDVLNSGAPGAPGNADLIFINGHTGTEPKGETYSINFTGPGSISVSEAGIINPINSDGTDPPTPASYGTTWTDLLTYEDLWNLGILQAQGESGLTGATFGDSFSVSGSSGVDNYVLTSLVVSGDFDNNGEVNGSDFLKWQRGELSNPLSAADLADWEDAFGVPALQAVVSSAVPEPSSWLLALAAGLLILGSLRQRHCLDVC